MVIIWRLAVRGNHHPPAAQILKISPKISPFCRIALQITAVIPPSALCALGSSDRLPHPSPRRPPNGVGRASGKGMDKGLVLDIGTNGLIYGRYRTQL